MHPCNRASTTIGVAFGMIIAVIFFAGSAFAATPYTDSPSLTLNTSNPNSCSPLTITGANFGPNEAVLSNLMSETVALGTATTDADGNFQLTVTLPTGYTDEHLIRAIGQTSDRTATAELTIGACGADTGVSNGGLPKTGAIALGAVGLIAVGLVVVGIALTSAKRRKINS